MTLQFYSTDVMIEDYMTKPPLVGNKIIEFRKVVMNLPDKIELDSRIVLGKV